MVVTEAPASLHVVGRTADGRLWHTIRSPGGWTPFGDVLAAAGLSSLSGHVIDVACVRRLPINSPVPQGLYVLVALDDQPPRLLLRSAGSGTWSQQPGAFFPTARKVAVGTLSTIEAPSRNEVHLAAVTDDGHLVTAVHDFTATQSVLPDDLEQSAGEIGDLRAVAMTAGVAISTSAVQLLAVTADGRLLQTTGRTGQWAAFTNILTSTQAGPLPAAVLDADLGNGANYVAVTGDGHVWLATFDGTWQTWRDLETFIATFSGGPGVGGTFTATQDVGTFATVSTATASEGIHIVGVTTNGQIWHQLRSSPSVIFRDVELVGVGQNVGTFTTAACG
jgi:hypothetical protein